MNIKKIKEEQIKLAQKIVVSDNFEAAETIGGVFQASFENKVISSVVICNLKDMSLIDRADHVEETTMPYIPGLASFRIAPSVVNAVSSLAKKPDILLCNFHGILHPNRLGPASHIGLLLDIPTIGTDKKIPCGVQDGNKIIFDKEIRAQILCTKEYAKPIYVSPGHRISLKSSVEIVEQCLKGHKLPEPLHIAHMYCNRVKKKLGIRA